MTKAILLAVALGGAAATAAGQQVLYGVGSSVGDGSSNLYRIASYGSAPTAIDLGETGIVLSDVAVHPVTGKLYALDLVTGNTLYEVNPTTAAVTSIGPTGLPTWINALEFDAAGTLYGWGDTNGDLSVIDVNTGAATTIGSVGYLSAGDLACDLDGTLWGASTSGLVRIDPLTGAGTLVGSFGVSFVYGIEVDVDGELYGFVGGIVSGKNDVYKISRTTGQATFFASVANASMLGVYGVAFAQTCGFTPYGIGAAPAQTMSTTWRPGAAPNVPNGAFRIQGGTANGAALLLVALNPASIPVGANTVLVDLSPGQFFTTSVPFGPTGSVGFPLSAVYPALAAAPLYVQALDLGATTTSNGLRMQFCP